MVFGMIQKLQNDIFCLTEERDYFQGKFLEQVSDIAALKEELQQAKKEINKLRHELMRMSTTNHTTTMIEDDHPHVVTADANLVEYLDGGKKMPEKDFKNDDVEDEDDDDDASSLTRSEALLARDEEEDDELDGESDLEEQPNVKPQTVTDAYSTPIKRSHRNRHYDDNGDDGDHEDDDDDDDASSHDSANDIRQSAERLLQWASYRALSNSTTPSASVATGSVDTSSHATPTRSSRNSQSCISDSNICHPKDKEPGIDHNDPQPTTTTANKILMTRRPLPLLGKLEQEEEEEDRQDIPHTTHHHHHIMEEKKTDEEEGTKENNHHGSKNNNTRAAAAVVVQI